MTDDQNGRPQDDRMDVPLGFPWSARTRRGKFRRIVQVLPMIAATLTFFLVERSDTPPPPSDLRTACGLAPKAVATDVNRAATVDVLIQGTPFCLARDGEAAMPVRIGSRVSVMLTSKTFPGRVELLGTNPQSVDTDRPVAQWTWEVLGDRPGKYTLSLIVSAVSEDGASVELQNLRGEIEVTVERTFGYMINSVLRTLEGFFTSVAGILTSVGVISAAAAGGLWHRRKAAGSRNKRSRRAMPRSRRRQRRRRALSSAASASKPPATAPADQAPRAAGDVS